MPDSVKEHAALLDVKLAEVRVCDPAIGSGAFPVAMMHEIVRARQALGSALTNQGGERTSYALKRHAIQHSLYGVDIDASAIDIAKLRLWLSLVVDEDDLAHVRPLPNLDYRIIHGNSLDAMRVSYENSLLQEQQLQTLRQAQDSYFDTTDKACKQRLRKDIDACRKKLGCSDFFEWTIDFHQVFHGGAGEENNGFDIVIANPPYVRQEKIKSNKKRLKAVFGDFFDGTADIYTYFYALALKQLLTPLGCCCYIAPNKFFRAAYGWNLRALLTSRVARLVSIIDFNELQLFKDATTYPAILLAQRATTLPQSSVWCCEIRDTALLPQLWHHVQQQGHAVPVRQLATDGWQLDDPTVAALLRKLQQNSTPLGNVAGVKMYYGIKTGCNEAFVIDGATRQRLLDEDPNSADVIFPWLRGRNLKRWQTEPSGKFVINIQNGGNHPWPWTGAEETEAEKLFAKRYPAIYRHLQPFREKLEKRSDQGEFFWELRACAYDSAFMNQKIVISAMRNDFYSFLDVGKAYSNDKTNILTCDEDNTIQLLCILNSKASLFFLKRICPKCKGNTFEFKIKYLKQLPIPVNINAATKQFLQEYNKIENLVKLDADITAQERKIDELVYDLYGLTTEERDIIENDIRQRG